MHLKIVGVSEERNGETVFGRIFLASIVLLFSLILISGSCKCCLWFQKLREVFKENPLPSRAFKEGLSKQLGLSFRKVRV